VRVWVITTSYPRSPDEAINAGVLARDLALDFHEMGHDVRVVTPRKPGGVEKDLVLDLTEIPWFSPTLTMSDLDPRHPRDLLAIVSLIVSSRWTMWSLARADQPDVIVALWAVPSGFMARWAARPHTQRAVWLLGSDVWNASRYPFGRQLLKSALSGVSGVYADGADLVEETTRLTGIVPEFLPSVRRLPGVARDKPRDNRILFVGRYHVNKGPDLLLDATAQILEEFPDVTLAMHGTGPLRDLLRERADVSDLRDHVSIGGPLSADEVASAMADAATLAIPSRVDSIPLVLGDAAQVGIPVVATDVGSLGHAVAAHDLGVVCPTATVDQIASGLAAALRAGRRSTLPNSYPKPGEAARRFLA